MARKNAHLKSEPSDTLENPKEETTEFDSFIKRFHELQAYKNNFFFQEQKRNNHITDGDFEKAIAVQKDMAISKANISEILLSFTDEIDRHHNNPNLPDIIKNKFTIKMLVAVAAKNTIEAVEQNPFLHQSYRLINKAGEKIQAMIEIANNKIDEDVNLHENLIQQDVQRGIATGLRGENFNSDSFAECAQIDQQRSKYKKCIKQSIESAKLIDIRKNLVNFFGRFC